MKASQMTRLLAVSLALVGLGAGAAMAAPAVPDWATAVENAVFPDEIPGIVRPAVGVYTNYYVYGVAPFGSSPEVYLSVDSEGYDAAVNMYVVLENRATGSALYYNIAQGWVNSVTDVFAQPGGSAVAIRTPDLDGMQLFGPQGALGSYNGPTATGQYQILVQFTTAGSPNSVVARDNAMYNFVDAAQTVQGQFDSANWTPNNVYVLTGPTRVTGTLTIQPGTFVLCSPDSDAVLSILQGAQMVADGTSKQPIVISSVQEWQDRAKGDCGGLTVNGFGTINAAGGEALGEGDSGTYGGNNPQDSSGIFRYLRVEFAGVLYTDQNELNGIAFQGVGANTIVERVQVSYGLDDGLENFGGNQDVNYAILYNNDDDSFDSTEGWSGTARMICVVQTSESTDKGFEIDGNADVFTAEPRTTGRFSGFTIVMTGTDDAMVFRVGSLYNLTNGLVLNAAGRKAIKLGDDDEPGDPTPGFPGTANGVIDNVFFQNGVAGDDGAIQAANLRLANPLSPIKPDLRVRNGSTGGQGCVTRADAWAYEEWTEWQPGPVQ